MQGRNFLRIGLLALVIALVLSACSGAAPNGGTPAAGVSAAVATATAATGAGGSSTPAQSQADAPTAAALVTAAPTVPASPAASPTVPQPPAASPAAPTQPGAVPSTGNGAIVPTDTVSALPDPAGYTWAPLASGLNKPLAFASLPDNSGRALVLEQPGTIRVVQNGNVLPDAFLDIQSRVGSRGSEQGLLGIALHPDYAKNGYFYINYTDVNGNTVIARYQVSQNDPNRADPNSEKVLLRVNQPFPNHNGGSMVFGPDGYLYMGLGDGGSAGDPHGNGQNVNALLGKILRVDVNGGDPYAIPPSNPFAKGGGKAEVWAYGLRNPWRFSFDRLTGDLYIADVGQDTWEEVDFLPAGSPGGANFGWNYREAAHPFQDTPPAGGKLVDPVAEYSHQSGCSVTGGYVYRGEALPEFRGVYLYADFCSGTIWGLLRGADGSWKNQALFQSGFNVTSFGQDSQGEIYVIDQGGGVYRLVKK